jgi:DNA-binding NtrC family response regulator
MSPDPILYVDSDLISRLLNCAILRDSGYVVLEAQSFAEACRVLERQPNLGALVTEVDLGGGRDGFDLSSRAHGLDPGLPVIYLGMGESLDNSRFIPQPFDGYQIVRALDVTGPFAHETRLDRAAPRAAI